MAESGQEKTEQPSDKRLRESREKGQVAKSLELNSVAIFSSGLLLVFLTQNFLAGRIKDTAYNIFGSLDILNININNFQELTKNGIIYFLVTLLPIFAGLVVIALAVSIAQIGFKMSFKAITPKFEKFNPFTGIKKIFFSSRSLVEVFKSLLKLIVIGGFTYFVLEEFVLATTNLVELSVPEIIEFMMDASYSLVWKVTLLYIAIAAIDFTFQKFKHKKDLMMTKQEVKEESRESDGNPEIKGKIRRLQYQMARKRMMQEIPKADVVITNPTHFAVALKFDSSKDQAPIVLAKGMDELAFRIKEIAKKNNIHIHEDKLLARALYKLCEVGDFIPQELFKSVAQILAYIYQLKRQKKKSIV